MDRNRTEADVKTFFHDFKEFAMRGNAIDMAVGIVIGTAFGAIAKSLVAVAALDPGKRFPQSPGEVRMQGAFAPA